MKKVWKWIVERLNGASSPAPLPRPIRPGLGEGGTADGNGDGDRNGSSPLPLSLALGTAEHSGEGNGDGARHGSASALPVSFGPSTARASGEGNDGGYDTLAKRLDQLKVRLKEIEEAMAVGDEDVTTDGAEVLAKARDLAGGDDGGLEMGDEVTVVVSRGVPQGIPGQQARRKAARLWEGVL